MSISQLAKELKQSATLVMTEKARRLREKAEPVISMAAGEPFRTTPDEAVKVGSEALATGRVHYSPCRGEPVLIDAVVDYTRRYYNTQIDSSNVMITAGAKHGLYNLLVSLVNPKEEVIVISPYWVSYPEMVRLVHARPVTVQPADGTHTPRLEDIESAVTPSTRAIIVNSPNNPSGVIYPPDLIGGLVELCQKKKIYLIMDDIYHRLVFHGAKAVPCFDFTDGMTDDSYIIVVNGVSKSYGMTGFRIGWSIANPQVSSALAKVSGQNTTCLSGPLQKAAAAALTGDQR
ncbi:MAG: aminotransferase class I/II-fold pyridoxal phosphate-dependent enzyme, partial [candidate division Zixibacteria bacterium]|nr:aminotransferase class I/II-fold pyridoxal phosphate-dependent enzyme [candidate division Zixibacteria bacterium]